MPISPLYNSPTRSSSRQTSRIARSPFKYCGWTRDDWQCSGSGLAQCRTRRLTIGSSFTTCQIFSTIFRSRPLLCTSEIRYFFHSGGIRAASFTPRMDGAVHRINDIPDKSNGDLRELGRDRQIHVSVHELRERHPTRGGPELELVSLLRPGFASRRNHARHGGERT